MGPVATEGPLLSNRRLVTSARLATDRGAPRVPPWRNAWTSTGQMTISTCAAVPWSLPPGDWWKGWLNVTAKASFPVSCGMPARSSDCRASLVPAEWNGAGQDLLSAVAVLEGIGYGARDNGLVFSVAAHAASCEGPVVRIRQRGAETGVVAAAGRRQRDRCHRHHGAGLGVERTRTWNDRGRESR